ncbi:hypothetical protein Tco_1112242 [Tanacetum coccineum]|uniref:Uncharacterized protein n=1 Tax=Tanacetum coccineum TaxID=301880 RepID=A0ABQ5ISG1_9ASTR
MDRSLYPPPSYGLNSPCFTDKYIDTSPKANGFVRYRQDKSLDNDSLLKTIRFSIHLVVYNEELAIPEQTATGKGTSNPLMAGSLPKTTKPTYVIFRCVAEKHVYDRKMDTEDVKIIKDQDQDLTECLDTSSKSSR